MANLPQSSSRWRYPRAHLESATPTVLRFANGQRLGAKLQVVSLSGGLLSLPQPLVQGSRVKLMFLTNSGSVFGRAEMLPPVTQALQPFRFVLLPAEDHRRLGELIGERINQLPSEHDWMEKLRAASQRRSEPRSWRFKVAGLVGMVMIGLATAAYLLHYGLLK